ncbi:unnamed protein product [Brassica napus]|uniref:(rape) hypothetical protein n=1 Tax=Brassica napus TaxID=3708 RepID=A0A816SZL6_BRANA|nr:unnamed protein product [Brassica napus]
MVVYTKRFSVSVQIYMCYFLLELNVYHYLLWSQMIRKSCPQGKKVFHKLSSQEQFDLSFSNGILY